MTKTNKRPAGKRPKQRGRPKNSSTDPVSKSNENARRKDTKPSETLEQARARISSMLPSAFPTLSEPAGEPEFTALGPSRRCTVEKILKDRGPEGTEETFMSSHRWMVKLYLGYAQWPGDGEDTQRQRDWYTNYVTRNDFPKIRKVSQSEVRPNAYNYSTPNEVAFVSTRCTATSFFHKSYANFDM
jgi:hypothetical protein